MKKTVGWPFFPLPAVPSKFCYWFRQSGDSFRAQCSYRLLFVALFKKPPTQSPPIALLTDVLSSVHTGLGEPHTPSIAFRHLPPNSARFSYAAGELFTSAQLSTDAVSALRKLIKLQPLRHPSLEEGAGDARSVGTDHTPSIAFRHLPPNSARFSYAT